MKPILDVIAVLWLFVCIVVWFFALAFSGDDPNASLFSMLLSASLSTLLLASPSIAWIGYGLYKSETHMLTKKGAIVICIALLLALLAFWQLNVFTPFFS